MGWERRLEYRNERDNLSCYNLNNRDILREVIVKIELERIDMQERVIVETLLDNSVTGLVMSSKFTRKQRFKLKKIEKPIYVRNMDGSFNKKRLIKHTVEGNAMASLPQFWNWLEDRRGEDNKMSRRVWKAVEIKIRKTRVAKTKRKREERGRGKETREERTEKEEKTKKERMMEVKRVVEEWEIGMGRKR